MANVLVLVNSSEESLDDFSCFNLELIDQSIVNTLKSGSACTHGVPEPQLKFLEL